VRAQVVVGAIAGVAALAYFILGRGYPWPLALMVGTAVGALVFTSLRASARVRNLHRRDDR
jgi:ABC-type cobalamin transport system permease subunit